MIVIRGKKPQGSRTRLRCRYGGQARPALQDEKRAPRVNRGALFARYGDGVLLLDVKRDGAFLAGIVGIARISGSYGAIATATTPSSAATTATGDYADEHGDGE